jgi:hypothetical protein
MSEQQGTSDQHGGVAEQRVRQCPFCKEEIKADAIKCKHCGSRVTPERPAHEGICPYCKEEIHPEAIKCKHCKSTLNIDEGADCGCKQDQGMAYAPSQSMQGCRGSDFGNAGTFREMMVGPSDIPGRFLFQMGSRGGFGDAGGFGDVLAMPGCWLIESCRYRCIEMPWGPVCGDVCVYRTVCG